MKCILKRDHSRYWVAHFKKGDAVTQRVVGTPTDDLDHCIAHVSRHWGLESLRVYKDDGSVVYVVL